MTQNFYGGLKNIGEASAPLSPHLSTPLAFGTVHEHLTMLWQKLSDKVEMNFVRTMLLIMGCHS